MWCIPKLTERFKERMEDLLDLYAEEYDPKRPVVCLDEKSKQLLQDSRPSLPRAPGKTVCRDYEYVRNGTANIFVAVEPKGKKSYTKVTKRRKKPDYARFILYLAEKKYPDADCIRIVQDNLNTHFEKSLVETFGERKTAELMKRIEFHYTPTHASWLNMAEIEIGILERQCLKGRIGSRQRIRKEVSAWNKRRNQNHPGISWKFTKTKAKEVFPELYALI
jgi:hypothetical protein